MTPLRIACAFGLVLAVGVAPAHGQGVASTFDQLGVLVGPRDRITVIDSAGRQTAGRVGSLTRHRLTLVTGDGLREFGEPDVAEVRQRRGDSLVNGAVIGAVSATVYFVTLAALLSDSDGGDVIISSAIAGGVMFAGMGAAAGAGIDALITTRQVIYRRPGSATRFSVSPLLGSGRRGVALAVRF